MERWKVLIADDEEIIALGLQRLYNWKENGFEIVGIAYDGEEALELAAQKKPDIVLMDINMPKISGLDAIEKMRLLLPDTSFIIISGYNQFEFAQRSIRLNVFDYLLKPVSVDELGAALFHAVERLKQSRAEQKNETGESEQIIYRIKTYIDEHLDQNLQLSAIAKIFHMNAGYLSLYFKRKTGINYHDYVMKRKVERARQLFETTDKTISEVARELGFGNYRSFSKIFKQHAGVLPSHYNRHSVNEDKDK